MMKQSQQPQAGQKPPPSNLKLIASALGLDRSGKDQDNAAAATTTTTTSPKVLPGGMKRSSLTKEASWSEIAARMEALNRSSSLGSSPSKSVLPDLALKRRSSETPSNNSPQKRPTSEDSERFYDCSEIGEAEPPSKKKAEEEQAPNNHLVARLQGNPRLRYWDSADHNMPSVAQSSG